MSDDRRNTVDPTAPLTHADAEALISARLDGPLDPVMNRALLAHLATCDSCREFAHDMDVMATAFRDFPSLPPSSAVSRRVRAEIRAGGSPVRRFGRWVTTSRTAPMTALAGAAVALALVTASVFGTLRDDDDNNNPSVGAPGVAVNGNPTESTRSAAQNIPTATNESGAENNNQVIPVPTPTGTININITAPAPTPTTEPAAPTDAPAGNDGGGLDAADAGVTNEPTTEPDSQAPTATEEPPVEPTTATDGASSGDGSAEQTPTAEPTRGGVGVAMAAEEGSPESEATATETPTEEATATPEPTETPTEAPTNTPEPTETPTEEPTNTPEPTEEATATPEPTETPTPAPTETPTEEPSPTPTEEPPATETPTAEPSPTPTEETAANIVADESSTPGTNEAPAEEPTPSPTPEVATPTPEAPTPTPPISPRGNGSADDAPSSDVSQSDQQSDEPTAEPEQPTIDEGQGSAADGESPPIQPVDGAEPSNDTTGAEDVTPEGETSTIDESQVTTEETSTPEAEGQGGEVATEEPTEEPAKSSGPVSFADLGSANFVAPVPGTYLPGPNGEFAAEQSGGGLQIIGADGSTIVNAFGYNPVWSSDGSLYAAGGAIREGSSALNRWPGANLPDYVTSGSYIDTPAGDGDGGFYYVRQLPGTATLELHTTSDESNIIWSADGYNLVAQSIYLYQGVVYIPTDQGWLAVTTGGEMMPLSAAIGDTYGLVLDTNSGQVAYVDGGGTVYVAPASDPSAASNAGSITGNGGIAWTPFGLAIASGSEVTIAGTTVIQDGGDLTTPIWTENGLMVTDTSAGDGRIITAEQIQQALGQ